MSIQQHYYFCYVLVFQESRHVMESSSDNLDDKKAKVEHMMKKVDDNIQCEDDMTNLYRKQAER